MGPWEWRWLVWMLTFVVLEGWAIATRETTLSEEVWRLFAVKAPNGLPARWRRLLLLILMAWLTAHFLTGGWV